MEYNVHVDAQIRKIGEYVIRLLMRRLICSQMNHRTLAMLDVVHAESRISSGVCQSSIALFEFVYILYIWNFLRKK